MRDIEPGRRPALQFMERAGFLFLFIIFGLNGEALRLSSLGFRLRLLPTGRDGARRSG
jgi:hypothetical protein